MRYLVGVGSAMLAALALTATITARSGDDGIGAIALKTLDTNVAYAIRLELSALNLARHGNTAGARKELENSRSLLQGAFGAADALTPP